MVRVSWRVVDADEVGCSRWLSRWSKGIKVVSVISESVFRVSGSAAERMVSGTCLS
jgi:hypothetical protein